MLARLTLAMVLTLLLPKAGAANATTEVPFVRPADDPFPPTVAIHPTDLLQAVLDSIEVYREPDEADESERPIPAVLGSIPAHHLPAYRNPDYG